MRRRMRYSANYPLDGNGIAHGLLGVTARGLRQRTDAGKDAFTLRFVEGAAVTLNDSETATIEQLSNRLLGKPPNMREIQKPVVLISKGPAIEPGLHAPVLGIGDARNHRGIGIKP